MREREPAYTKEHLELAYTKDTEKEPAYTKEHMDTLKEKSSLIPCGKFGSPYLGKATAAARAALPIPNSACGIFVCPNKVTAANV